MEKTINIIGAFDRYNYGDLLFPIIIEEYIKKYREELLKKYQLKYFALVESDLTNIGGKKTEPLATLYRDKIEKGSVLIVSGGDVIPARIGNMDIDLAQNFNEMIYKKIKRKLLGIENFEKSSKKRFEIDSAFPWLIDEKNFQGNLKVFYNAVGGSTLDKLPIKDQQYIKETMKNSSYISVRDVKSRDNINHLEVNISPDSATIMSEFFDFELLEKKSSEKINKFIKNNEEYIVIQSNNSSLKEGKDRELIEAINAIGEKLGYKILLLPIGFAANHDDNIALNKVKKGLTVKYEHFESLNLYEVMHLIAKGSFFAGTSLHGNITAMSYGVPHIGLNREIKKLDSYLKTWDLEEQNRCIDFSELENEIEKLIKLDKKKLLVKRKELIEKVKGNFHNMLALMEQNNE